MKKIIKYLSLSLLALPLILTSCGESESPASSDAGYYNSGEKSSGDSDSSTIDINEDENRKIYYTVNLTIESESLKEVIDAVGLKVSTYEGYKGDSSFYYDDNGNISSGSCVYRIKPSKLNAFLNDLTESCNIVNQSTTSTEVTSTYNQILARIETLTASKTAYQQLLAGGGLSINDIIAINDKLNDINTELSYLSRQQATLDSLIEYSVVNVRYTTKYNPVDDSFFAEWIEYVGKYFVFIFEAIMYLLPIALTGGVITGIVFLVLFLNKKKKLAKKEIAQKKEVLK